MAGKETPEQKGIVGRVMHEFKHGQLQSGSGDKVSSPRQAIAIALSEAGVSTQNSPQQNSKALKRTREREPNRAELYAAAKRDGIEGRSKMNKAELQRALRAKRH